MARTDGQPRSLRRHPLGRERRTPYTEVDCSTRGVRIAQQTVEIGGKLHITPPKYEKIRHTIYPTTTPAGYPLAEAVARRRKEAEVEHKQDRNPHRLLFTAPRGGYLRSSNFRNRVLNPAYEAAGWGEPAEVSSDDDGGWVWHSLRHVFCTTALNGWKLDIADVSVLAGHSTPRSTMDVYVGKTRGVLSRAHTATQ